MKQNIIRIMVCALAVTFALTGSSMASDTGKKAAAPATQEKAAAPADTKPAAPADQEKPAAPADTKSAAPADEKSAPAENQVTVTGTVEKTDAGIVIKTADAVLTVAGKDLAEMVGKTVNATGTVDKQTISVTEVKEATDK